VLTTGALCVNTKLTLALKDGKLSAHNLPFGSVVREGNQLNMEISIPNTLFKQMPSDLLTQGEGAFVLKAIADQGLDLKIRPPVTNYSPPPRHIARYSTATAPAPAGVVAVLRLGGVHNYRYFVYLLSPKTMDACLTLRREYNYN